MIYVIFKGVPVKRHFRIFLSLAATSAAVSLFPSKGQAFDAAVVPPHAHPSADTRLISISNSEEDMIAGAKTFIEKLSSRGIGFLADASLSEEQREAEFRKLLKDSFDMKTIGRFALGRYWKTSTKKEQEEYLRLFENMIVNVYSKRFSEYNGEMLEVGSASATGDSDAIVSSYLVPDDGPKISVDWRVRYKNGQYKVVDIIVEKVSMSLTQRSDFASVIQRGGGQVEVLLSHLREE